MPYDLRRTIPKERRPKLQLHYDEDGLQLQSEKELGYAGTLTFYGRLRTGADAKAINDQMITVDEDGDQSVRAGSSMFLKVLSTVTEIDGLYDGETPVTQMTDQVLGMLPEWMLAELRDWSDKLNSKTKKKAGE